MKTDLIVEGIIIDKDKTLLIYHKDLEKWLPVAGHIKQNETPDQALLREVDEEVGIKVEILGKSDIPFEGNIKENLATPFYVNLHSVGDHDHCTLFYVCKAINPEELILNEEESEDFKWITKKELENKEIPLDVKNICLKAFDICEELK